MGREVAASLDVVIEAPDAGAVYVCIPNFLHRPTALRAAAAGKHVFIEKPMGSPEDAEAIVEGCRRHAVACGVPFSYGRLPRIAHRATCRGRDDRGSHGLPDLLPSGQACVVLAWGVVRTNARRMADDLVQVGG